MVALVVYTLHPYCSITNGVCLIFYFVLFTFSLILCFIVRFIGKESVFILRLLFSVAVCAVFFLLLHLSEMYSHVEMNGDEYVVVSSHMRVRSPFVSIV